MNITEELQFAYRLRRQLNLDVSRMPAATAERLRAARERALARQSKVSGGLAAAGVPTTFGFAWMGQLAPLLVLVGGLVAINYWHQSQRAVEIADIDMQVLVDELPPNAYADKGFGAWLGRAEQ